MRRSLILMLLITAVVLPIGRVAAHAALSASTPADGSRVTEPLGEVTLTFSEGVEPTAEGFAITVDATTVEAAATTADGAHWVLTFGPISSGVVTVAYDVVSTDGHLIAGDLSFTVDAAAPATTAAPSSTTAPPPAATVAPTPATAPTTITVAVATTTAPAGTPSTATTAAADTEDGGSDTALWVAVIGGGVILLGVLGWGVARRARP